MREGKAPTPEEIGNKIADALGFNQSEREVYASLKRCKTPGEAFFQAANKNSEGINWLELAKTDPMGRVRISEMHPGAIAETRQWLLDFRARHAAPDAISQYDYDSQRTVMEAVVANVYNPIAGGVGAAMGSIGDVVQGLGLPLHAIYNRTFMDNLADALRKEGRELPMYSLYNRAEMNDAIVGLANMYCMAGGSALPYMGPGLLARGAALTPRAVGLVGRLTGLSGTTGQVYDTALEIQAAEVARKEGVTGDGALLKRIEQIKKGESLDPATRSEIETRSLIATALSAPMGMIQGNYLKSLCGHIAAETPTKHIPRALLKEIAVSLSKGGALSASQYAYMQTALFAGGVQGGDETMRNIASGTPEAAVKGAMIAGGFEALRATKPRVQTPGVVSKAPEGIVEKQPQPKVEAVQMQPQPYQQQQSRHLGRTDYPAHQPQEAQYDRFRRAQFEAQVQQMGFHHAAQEDSVSVYSGQIKNHGVPESRDYWYANGDALQHLRYSEGWYYGKQHQAHDVIAPLKVHVLTNSGADLKALQKVLIPALNNDPELRGIVTWKTMDPMRGFGQSRYVPTGIGQDGKAFTIYARTAKDAEYIHRRIDQILTHNNLRAHGLIASQTTDIPSGTSNRVALCVDNFDRTVTTDNRAAAVVDYHVEQALKYVNGIPHQLRLTDHQLRKIEADCGLQARLLSYDAYGRLAMETEGSPYARNAKIYVTEAGAQHIRGAMTGRYAMYSLYRRVNIEPSRSELLK